MRRFALLIFFTAHAFCSFAQQDKFAGVWQAVSSRGENDGIYVSVQIARPEQGLLYPAQITIKSGNFSGVYQLLLVKKAEDGLAIGRNKFPVQEVPFSLGRWTMLLNGSLDLSMNEKGKPSLNVHRIPARRFGFQMPQLAQFADSNRNAAIALSNFLKDSSMHLEKVSEQPWRSGATEGILHTYNAPAYFGLVDSMHTARAGASISFAENNKSDNDSISVSFNGKAIIGKMDINHPKSFDITLDTGLNILCFFADNYGAVPPNTARMNIALADKKYTLDFTRKENMSATFIVAKIYFYPGGKENNTGIAARKTIIEKIHKRNTVQIDSIAATMQEITLAIWDDAVEDGDSISLQINDEIYMPGIAVKKKPQFFTVKLYPGDNKIIFIADNLGAISPNTSVLEIIDGKRRKSYMINTSLAQNNSIKILYNPAPQ